MIFTIRFWSKVYIQLLWISQLGIYWWIWIVFFFFQILRLNIIQLKSNNWVFKFVHTVGFSLNHTRSKILLQAQPNVRFSPQLINLHKHKYGYKLLNFYYWANMCCDSSWNSFLTHTLSTNHYMRNLIKTLPYKTEGDMYSFNDCYFYY